MNKVFTMKVEELKQNLCDGGVVLIDVREPAEYAEGYIEGAINMPLSVILDVIEKLNITPDKKLVMQCRIGKRSMLACVKLQSDGYDFDLWNLEGGINEWQEAGYEIKNNFL